MTDNSRIHPLVLSFWSPPVVRPQAILLGKMLPEWVRQGTTPVLVHYDICGAWDIDIPRYGIPQFVPLGIWKFPFLNYFAQWRYRRSVVAMILPLVRAHSINVIYSFANPPISNIIGAQLARKTGLPYVAHFSDPWESEYRQFKYLGSLKVRSEERYVVEASDYITTVDEPMREYIMKKYPPETRGKAVVVNHCFNPEDYPKDVVPNTSTFTISHMGTFYSKRTPEVLFVAIKKLLEQEAHLRTKLTIELIGGISLYGSYRQSDLDTLVSVYGLDGIVRVLPPTSFKKSLAAMKASDCLVVIDPPFSYFIASKLIDYAGADRPVIAIAPRGSSTAEVATKLGYRAFTYEETNELTQYLSRLIAKHTVPVANVSYRNTFHVKETTRVLFQVFRDAMKVGSMRKIRYDTENPAIVGGSSNKFL